MGAGGGGCLCFEAPFPLQNFSLDFHVSPYSTNRKTHAEGIFVYPLRPESRVDKMY